MTKKYFDLLNLMFIFLCSPLILAQQNSEINTDTLFNRSASLISFAGCYANGIDINRDIYKIEFRAGYEKFFRYTFSGGPEIAALLFKGTREELSIETLGFTAAYILKWHFVKKENLTVYFNFGFGGAYFTKEFPPGGTKFNGFSQFGLGMNLQTGINNYLLLDIRQMHHSNGKGIVENNPAFDGASIHIGLGFKL